MSDLQLRRLTPAEADLAADLLTAIRPDEPSDPVALRYQMASNHFGWTYAWDVALAGRRPVGIGQVIHAPWAREPERCCYVYAGLVPAVLASGELARLYDLIEELALADEPRRLATWCYADETVHKAELERRGYRLDREGKVWELDLRQRRDALLTERERTREEMRKQRLALMTLEASRDPERNAKLLDLLNRTQQDMPHSLPIHDETIEELEQRLGAPDVREDRFWTAWSGDRLLAVSYLRYPPVRGNVWTEFTACDRPYRGRGIARAVKMESLGQAIELGVERVRTDNDGENAAMLHINETLGYRLLPGELSFLRDV